MTLPGRLSRDRQQLLDQEKQANAYKVKAAGEDMGNQERITEENGRRMNIQCKSCKGWHWDFYDYCVICCHGYEEMDMSRMITIEWYEVIE